MSKRLRILLVEDNSDDAILFARALESAQLNADLHTVSDGQTAIDYLAGTGVYADRRTYPMPQLVVLDLKIPGVDGLGVLTWRRASVPLTRLPFVAFSGAPLEMQKAVELGANRNFFKPHVFADWINVVREIYDTGQRWQALGAAG